MAWPRVARHAAIAAIALAAVPANLALGVSWQVAVPAGVAVLIFGELISLRSQSETSPAPSKPDPKPAGAGPLTRRELEIAGLVAKDMTNKEIGRQLFISERTVDNHVQHIYNKIGVDSRLALALWMRERGLLTESARLR